MGQNAHHPEFWWPPHAVKCPTTPEQRVCAGATARRMAPEVLVEMITDWHAASLAYENCVPQPARGAWPFLKTNAFSTGLHPASELQFLTLMCHLGFREEFGGKAQLLELIDHSPSITKAEAKQLAAMVRVA
eukprot:PhM_4_TR2045/c3_g1_i1/m.95492